MNETSMIKAVKACFQCAENQAFYRSNHSILFYRNSTVYAKSTFVSEGTSLVAILIFRWNKEFRPRNSRAEARSHRDHIPLARSAHPPKGFVSWGTKFPMIQRNRHYMCNDGSRCFC